MPYNFSTKPGRPAAFKLLVKANADSYDLTAEFTKSKIPQLQWHTSTEPVILSVPVESNGNELTINLTAEQVDFVGRSYYRIKAVKDGNTLYIENGKLEVYHGTPSVEVRGPNLFVRDPGGGEVLAGSVIGPQGIQGEKGDKGDKGDTGLQGIQGIQGLTGPPIDLSDVGTSANTPNELVRRNGAGDITVNALNIANVGAPGAGQAVRRDYVDGVGGTGANPNTIMRRDNSANSFLNRLFLSQSPSAVSEATRKDYVDALGTDLSTPSTVVRRNGSNTFTAGRVFVDATAPSAVNELTRKDYVDAMAKLVGPYFTTAATYTFAAADANRQVDINSTPAASVTIPADAAVNFPLGTVLTVMQFGPGTVSFVADTGVIIDAPHGYAWSTSGVKATVYARKRDVNRWVLSGELLPNTPTQPYHLTRKDYVDALGTTTPSPSAIVRRDVNGWMNAVGLQVTAGVASASAPVNAADLTRKDYVDALGVSGIATPDTVMRRDTNGDTAVRYMSMTGTTPSAGHAVRKDYVDTAATQGDFAVSDTFTWTAGAQDLTAWTTPGTKLRTLGGNTSIGTMPAGFGATRSGTITVIVKQPATGGPYTMTWPATLVWAGGAPAPVMPTAANAEMIVSLFWIGSAWRATHIGTFYP